MKRLAWLSAGMPFGYVETIEDEPAPDVYTGATMLAVVAQRRAETGPPFGALVVVREMRGTLYVCAQDNAGVLWEGTPEVSQ